MLLAIKKKKQQKTDHPGTLQHRGTLELCEVKECRQTRLHRHLHLEEMLSSSHMVLGVEERNGSQVLGFF